MFHIQFLIVPILCLNQHQLTHALTAVLDLTWDFNNKTVYWPNAKPFGYTKIVHGTVQGQWYAANEFEAGEHGGTHMDAPYHFNEGGLKIGQIPLSHLVVEGSFVDVSDLVKRQGSEFLLNSTHLSEWDSKNGPFPNDSVVLIKFGWSQYWPNKRLYLGMDADKKLHFPGMSESAARWIANSGKFVGVGVDVASVDHGDCESQYPAHRILSQHNIYSLENVKLTLTLPAKGFTLILAPMKLEEGTGAPTRILALPFVKDL